MNVNALILLLLLALSLGSLSACKKDEETKPDASTTPATTTEKPDAAPTEADAAPAEADAAEAAEAKDEDAGGGSELLPEPDFNLGSPTLKAPGGKKGSLLGGDDGEDEDKKPRLLDTELKKE